MEEERRRVEERDGGGMGEAMQADVKGTALAGMAL
jgi:hypothetical protein